MDGLRVLFHLDAKGPPGEGMFGIARNLDRFSIDHLYQKPAGIRTVIRADGAFHRFRHKKSPLSVFKLTTVQNISHIHGNFNLPCNGWPFKLKYLKDHVRIFEVDF
jgi:hypothetical protein